MEEYTFLKKKYNYTCALKKHTFNEDSDGVCDLCGWECPHISLTGSECEMCNSRYICKRCKTVGTSFYHCTTGSFCKECCTPDMYSDS